MSKGRRILGAAASAAVLLVALVPSALAYQGQVSYSIGVSSGGHTGSIDTTCGTAVTVNALITNVTTNSPAVNATVAWTFGSGSQAGDSLAHPTSITDATGNAVITVVLACNVGDRVVVGTFTYDDAAPNAVPTPTPAVANPNAMQSISSQVTLSVKSIVGGVTFAPGSSSGTGLPPTSTSPTGDLAIPWQTLLAVAAIALALALVGHRRLANR